MQEKTETEIMSTPETLITEQKVPLSHNDSRERNILKRYHRILIVNETIETYLETSSDDSDSNELCIDESVRDIPFISENHTVKSLYCNTPVLNLISEENEQTDSTVQQKVDGFSKIVLDEWPIREKLVVSESPKNELLTSDNLKDDKSLNGDSEVLDLKPEIDTSEITIINQLITDDWSHEDKTIFSLPVLNSPQNDVRIFEQRFRKIAPKEMPVNSNVIDNENWRINPRKTTVKNKKKIISKYKRKHSINFKRKRKIRYRIVKNPRENPTDVEDLAMEIEEYVPPELHIEVKESQEETQLESGLNLIQCPYCSFKNPKEACVKKHLAMFHVFTNCPHCKFQTLSWRTMDRHFVQHFTNGVSFTCPFCKEAFHKLSLLKSHWYASHKQSDPSECFLCGLKVPTPETFTNIMKSLRKHVHDEHLNKSVVIYDCPLCDFRTTLDLEMKSHIYLSHEHLKGNIYQCLQCPNIIRTLTELVHHLNIHRNDIRLACGFCKFVCTNNLRMTLHKNTHSERAFKCPYCCVKFEHHFLVKYHIQSKHIRKKLPINKR